MFAAKAIVAGVLSAVGAVAYAFTPETMPEAQQAILAAVAVLNPAAVYGIRNR